jgi:hypothetical protein
MSVKNIIFLDLIPYSPVKVYRCFAGTYCLSIQSLTIIKTELLATCFLSLLFEPEDEGISLLQQVGKLLSDCTVSHP